MTILIYMLPLLPLIFFRIQKQVVVKKDSYILKDGFLFFTEGSTLNIMKSCESVSCRKRAYESKRIGCYEVRYDHHNNCFYFLKDFVKYKIVIV